jgi:hypothetical protein
MMDLSSSLCDSLPEGNPISHVEFSNVLHEANSGPSDLRELR